MHHHDTRCVDRAAAWKPQHASAPFNLPFNLLRHLSSKAPFQQHKPQSIGLKHARTSPALCRLVSLLPMEVQALEPAKAGTCSFRSAHSVQFTSGGDGEAHLLICDGMGKLALHETEGSCREVKEVDQESATSVACLTVSPSGHHFACASDQNHVKVGPKIESSILCTATLAGFLTAACG